MKVIGTELYDQGFEEAISALLEGLKTQPESKCLSPSDANVLVHARKNEAFRSILHSFYWNLPDGVPSVWILKLKGAKKANRISGPEFFEAVIKRTSNLPVQHYFCGGAEGVAKDLAEVSKRWGNPNIAGFHSPPFEELTQAFIAQEAKKIQSAKPTIVWVGLGAPKQIYFSYELSKILSTHYIIPIGAAFDFHTGRVKKAPKWIQKIGMEWCYRLFQEPKRLLKRYLKVVPLFIWYNLIDLFKK